MIKGFAASGADYISFHPDASTHVHRSLQLIRNSGCKAGLVFNPAASLDALKYVMDKVDLILIMSVNPGFGGQSFIESSYSKIIEARKLIDKSGFDIQLEVDGGIGIQNIKKIAQAGANMFVSGSAIFNSDDYNFVISKMRTQIETSLH